MEMTGLRPCKTFGKKLQNICPGEGLRCCVSSWEESYYDCSIVSICRFTYQSVERKVRTALTKILGLVAIACIGIVASPDSGKAEETTDPDSTRYITYCYPDGTYDCMPKCTYPLTCCNSH